MPICVSYFKTTCAVLDPSQYRCKTTLSSAVSVATLILVILIASSVGGCHSAEKLVSDPLPPEAAQKPEGRIPLTAFASLPRIDSMELSPSGSHVAFIQNTGSKTYLVTAAYDGSNRRKVLEAENKQYWIRWFDWINDERLLIGVSATDTINYTGVPIKYTRTLLFAVNHDGSNLKTDLTKPNLNNDFRIVAPNHSPQFQDMVIGQIPGESGQVLIALDFKNPMYPDVYKLDVYTGQRELVERSTYGIRRWMVDRQGTVRLGQAVDGTTIHILIKPPGSDAWRTLSKFDALREPGIIPLGFDEDPNVLFVQKNLNGRAAVSKMNISQPESPSELVASHAVYDVGGNIIYSQWRKQVIGIRHLEDESKVIYWDVEAAALQTGIDLALSGRVNVVHSSSRDGCRHIVASSHPTQPREWYVMDEDLNRLTWVAEDYPLLTPKELVAPASITFKARDGTVLHGYLTRPPHETGRHPLVVLPHGGPSARDSHRFDYWAQFLVSRGWAVLQVNFRGSSGYGSAFQGAGYKRWGLEMQDDLTDGVQYAVTNGVADPQRVCIVGGSYGGYAALMGTVKTPDLYRCAVSFAGVSDLKAFLEENRHYLDYKLGWERQLGSSWSDRDRLKATSPVNHADKIHTPLLIVHGVEDQVVSVEQSRRMVKALKEAGFEDVRYIELADADNHLSREEDRLTFFRELEHFLRKYLDQAMTEPVSLFSP